MAAYRIDDDQSAARCNRQVCERQGTSRAGRKGRVAEHCHIAYVPVVTRPNALSNFELAACAARSASRGATSANNALHGRDQPIELDRLGIEFVASRSDRLVTLASERMGGERNDWNITGLRIVA